MRANGKRMPTPPKPGECRDGKGCVRLGEGIGGLLRCGIKN